MRLRAGRADAANLRVFPKGRGGEKIAGEISIVGRRSGHIREDGAADFDKLHSRCFESDVVLYAFDLIELNGSDLSKRPLDERKKVLAQLLKRPLRNNAE
jgi:ATP-dependent DNA ligase